MEAHPPRPVEPQAPPHQHEPRGRARRRVPHRHADARRHDARRHRRAARSTATPKPTCSCATPPSTGATRWSSAAASTTRSSPSSPSVDGVAVAAPVDRRLRPDRRIGRRSDRRRRTADARRQLDRRSSSSTRSRSTKAAPRKPPARSSSTVARRRLGELEVGDTTTLRTPDPLEVTIVGIAKFGSVDGLAGASSRGVHDRSGT